MGKAIIHISDLHVSIHETLKKEKIICKSFLTTNPVVSENDNFIKEFTDKIKKQFSGYELYLIISGDIADKGIVEEYETAESIIKKIITDLNIDKKKLLIVPGDHDINWEDCKSAHQKGKRDNDTRNSFEYFDDKFKNFKNFYDKFYDGTKVFDPNNMLVDHISISEDDKLLIVGLNSNYKIDYDGGNGFFKIEDLRTELETLIKSFSEFSIIAVFHHNIFASYENKMKGQWDDSESNRLAVFGVFQELGIITLFYGNEHTRCSFYNSNHKLTYSDSGAFATNQDLIPSFKVYEVINDKSKLILKNNLFLLLKGGLTDIEFPFGKWTLQMQDQLDGELEEIPIRIPEEYEIKEDLSLDVKSEVSIISSLPEKSFVPEFISLPENYIPFDVNDDDHKSLLKTIKLKNLFHSGHFHWSETSRAHNWIDISKLLNNKEDLLNAKKFIINIIDKNKLDFDFIIGLGIEGNMLATRASVIKDKDYSFLPYSYRYEDHSDYEKKLNFENDGSYQTVLIITDVVHDGRTIRKLIHKKRDNDTTSNFFINVKKVIVISLFYTGELTNDKSNYYDLLNKKVKDEKFDNENDHLEDRIQFHFVSHIKVQECPYNKNNYKNDCIIVKEGLCGIHKFYTEKAEA